jgi:hypothetical protein
MSAAEILEGGAITLPYSKRTKKKIIFYEH